MQITRDGIAVRAPQWGVALPADSGEHEITASAPGYERFESKVTVTGEGSTATATVPALVPQLAAPAPIVSRPQPEHVEPQPSANHGLGTPRTIALVAGGLGLVGVGLGTAFGLASKSKHDEAARYCNGTACTDQRGVTSGNAAQRDGNLSTAMMIVGGVGLAAGVTLWLTAPKAGHDAPPAQVGLGLGTVQVKGAF